MTDVNIFKLTHYNTNDLAEVQSRWQPWRLFVLLKRKNSFCAQYRISVKCNTTKQRTVAIFLTWLLENKGRPSLPFQEGSLLKICFALRKCKYKEPCRRQNKYHLHWKDRSDLWSIWWHRVKWQVVICFRYKFFLQFSTKFWTKYNGNTS